MDQDMKIAKQGEINLESLLPSPPSTTVNKSNDI